PTATSRSFFRAATSTTVTVPLSRLATRRSLPSGDTSRRLLEGPATAGAATRAARRQAAAWRDDIGVSWDGRDGRWAPVIIGSGGRDCNRPPSQQVAARTTTRYDGDRGGRPR